MEQLVNAIPAVARSPLALVAYIALVIAAVVLRVHSNSQMAKQKRIESAPESVRQEVIDMELGRVPKTSTQEDVRRRLKLQYQFFGYLSTLFFIFSIVGIFAAGYTFFSPGTSCSGEGCSGKDPGSTGCSTGSGTTDTAEVKDTQGKVIGSIELRWSDKCQTNWARATSMLPTNPVKLRTYLRDKDGNLLNDTLLEAQGNQVYGNMWYAPTGKIYVKACGVIAENKEACTNLH